MVPLKCNIEYILSIWVSVYSNISSGVNEHRWVQTSVSYIALLCPFVEMHQIHSGYSETKIHSDFWSKNYYWYTVNRKNVFRKWRYRRHSRRALIWLDDPFDSWSSQIPKEPEAKTPASATEEKRESAPSVWSHLDRCCEMKSPQWTPPYSLCHRLRVSQGNMSH